MNRYNFIAPATHEDTKTVHIFTDGSCAPSNPGPGGIGIHCCDEHGIDVFNIFSFITDTATNNQMEYLAMLMAVRSLRSKSIYSRFKAAKIFTDSRMIVTTLQNAQFAAHGKNAILSNLRAMIMREIDRCPMMLDIQWINREQNEKADVLSKKGSAGGTLVEGLGIGSEEFEASAFGHLFKAVKEAKKAKRQSDDEEDNMLWGW